MRQSPHAPAIAVCVLVAMIAQPAFAYQNTTPQCPKAILVYLDISQSMYEESYNPKVTFRQQKAYLIQAMLKFISETFSEPGLLTRGDSLEIGGFGNSVTSLMDPVNRYNPDQDSDRRQVELLSNLYSILHADPTQPFDRAEFRREVGRRNDDPEILNRTYFARLLHHVDSRIGQYLSTVPKNRTYTTVIIFTDGGIEDEAQAKEAMREFRVKYQPYADLGMLRIILLTLYKPSDKSSDVGALFRDLLKADVGDFYAHDDVDIDTLSQRIKGDIQEALLGRVIFSPKDGFTHQPDDRNAGKFDFTLRLQSTSCESHTVGGKYWVTPIRDGKPDVSRRRRFDLPKGETISAMGEWALTVPVDLSSRELSNLGASDYSVEFNLALDDSALPLPSQAVTLHYEKGGVSSTVILIGLLLLLLVAGLALLIWTRRARPKRKPYARSAYK